MTSEGTKPAGRPLMWLVILFCLGGLVAGYYAQQAEAEKYEKPLMPCFYGPDGKPAHTPCAK